MEPQRMLLLAEAAAAQGDLEVAYCLYAKGAFPTQPATAVADNKDKHVQALAAGRLTTLAEMCKVPSTTAPSVDAEGPHPGSNLSNSPLCSFSSNHRPAPLPKRWQHMQSRLQMPPPQCSAPGPCCCCQEPHQAQPSVPDDQHARSQHVKPPCGAPHHSQEPSVTTPSTAGCQGSSIATSSGPNCPSHHCWCCTSTHRQRRRVFCVSDLHVDRAGGANMRWVQQISTTCFQDDVLIVAGDVADTAAAVSAAFKLLSSRFWRVVWLPGNHEAWLRPDTSDGSTYPDSWAKIMALRQIADAAGVDVGPIEVVPGLVVLPLLSWYNDAFDVNYPRPGRYRHDSFCRWGDVPEAQVWQVLLALNTPAVHLVQQYAHAWRTRQQQQQQQQLPASCSPVHQQQQPAINNSSSSRSRTTHALTLSPHQQQQQQQQQGQALLPSQQQQQQHVPPVGPPQGPCLPPSRQPSRVHQAAAGVTWAASGALAVNSRQGRVVPGLQLNLAPHTRTHTAARGAADGSGGAGVATAVVQQPPAGGGSATAAAAAPDSTVHALGSGRSPARTCSLLSSSSSGSWEIINVSGSSSPTRNSSSCSSSSGTEVSCPGPVPVTAAAMPQCSPGTAEADAAAAPCCSTPQAADMGQPGLTVITVSHFLPHPDLPHSHMSDLTKAMGCLQLQDLLQQVSSSLHVYGHSHRCCDITLPYTHPATTRLDAGIGSSSSSAVPSRTPGPQQQQQGACRYVQYALDAVGREAAGLYCLWDGQQLAAPGCVVPPQ